MVPNKWDQAPGAGSVAPPDALREERASETQLEQLTSAIAHDGQENGERLKNYILPKLSPESKSIVAKQMQDYKTWTLLAYSLRLRKSVRDAPGPVQLLD